MPKKERSRSNSSKEKDSRRRGTRSDRSRNWNEERFWWHDDDYDDDKGRYDDFDINIGRGNTRSASGA